MCQMILILNFKKYYNKNIQWASEFLTLQNFGYHSTWHCFPVLKFTKKYSNIWIVNWLQARYVQFLKKVLNGSGSKQKWIMYHNLQFGRNVCIPYKVQTFWEGHKILQNLHRRFVLCSASQIYGEDFANFCGLLRIYEL